MRKINRKLFLSLKIVYGIAFIVAVVAILGTPTFLDPYLGFFQGGIIEIVLLISSIFLFHNLKIRVALITGILGTIVYGIDILYSSFLIRIAGRFIGARETLFMNPICWVIILSVNVILYIAKLNDRRIDLIEIKKKILDMGFKFTRLEIKAISEKINQDPALIAEIIQDMVEKQEIYGFYFKSTKTIAFNQQANIDEIDKLLSKFSEFEEKQMSKKI